jgi:hypothetical protein
MLQAGRSRIQFQMKSFHFYNSPNPLGPTLAPVSTQPLTEMIIGNPVGVEGRPARKAENLNATCETVV